jgi:arylsulfatase
MAIYAAMIQVMDQQVGRLIDYLKDIGEYDNTVFLVLSDNGAAFLPTGGLQVTSTYRNTVFTGDCSSNGDISTIPKNFDDQCYNAYKNMGSGTSFINPDIGWGTVTNTPWKRYKGDTFEGGVHTAAFVSYPKLEEARGMDKCLRSIMDIAPTILEMANIGYPNDYKGKPNKPMQGVSMADLFSASPKACNTGRWLAWEQDSVKGVRQGDWKLSQKWWETQSRWDPNWYLYNLADDPFEQHDLKETRPDKFKRMKCLYRKYARENGVVKVGSKILPELYRGPGKLGEQALIMGGVSIKYNRFQQKARVNPSDKQVEIDAVIRPASQQIGKPGKVAVIIVPYNVNYDSPSYALDYYVLTPGGSFDLWKSQADLGNELPSPYKTYPDGLPDWIEISNADIKKVAFDFPFEKGYTQYDIMLGYWLDGDEKMIYNTTPIRLTWNETAPPKQQPTKANRDNVE